jgi:hypothetical protein
MSYPALPKDHVYLGLGGTFLTNGETFQGFGTASHTDRWEPAIAWDGASRTVRYCAHKDSEIVKLNTPAPAPIAAAQPTRFIVWTVGDDIACLKPDANGHLHASRDTADAEAQRLAAKHPTMVFSVCEIVARYKATVTVNRV